MPKNLAVYRTAYETGAPHNNQKEKLSFQSILIHLTVSILVTR